MERKLIMGSRGSKLALIQAESVVARIKELNPAVEVSISRIVTKGDRNRRLQIDRMEGVGVFVKELEEALLEGRIDLAVHSLKDVPTEIPPGLCLAAVTERLDPRDILVSRSKGLTSLAAGAKVGTGSLRRALQLAVYRPDLEVCGIRGNVETRLRKVIEGELDGVILAAAAMKRLGWEDRITEYLPLEHFLPAVGQGALVIETRLDDAEIVGFVAPLNHFPTWRAITAERAFLRALGGGCRAPIAALGTVNGDNLKLEGMVADASSHSMLRSVEEGKAALAEGVGIQLAQRLLEIGASEFIAEAKNRDDG